MQTIGNGRARAHDDGSGDPIGCRRARCMCIARVDAVRDGAAHQRVRTGPGARIAAREAEPAVPAGRRAG